MVKNDRSGEKLYKDFKKGKNRDIYDFSVFLIVDATFWPNIHF